MSIDDVMRNAALKQTFLESAMEWNRLRDEMSKFCNPTDRVRVWSALASRHLDAERTMRAAYRALMQADPDGTIWKQVGRVAP